MAAITICSDFGAPKNKVWHCFHCLKHRTLLLSPVTSTTGYCFCFGSNPSLFLELFLHWSPVAYWAPNDLGSSSFGILSFCLFLLFMGFSRQKCWSGLPFPSPVDHILSDLFPFSSGPHSVRPLHHDPPVVGCPAGMAYFHWVRQDCDTSVIRLTRFLWVWFQCLCGSQ